MKSWSATVGRLENASGCVHDRISVPFNIFCCHDSPASVGNLRLPGRAIVLTLFVIGVWHLVTRLREYFDHYTYSPKAIRSSIMEDGEKPEQPFSRFSAYTFLLVGYGVSVAIGLVIGWHAQDFFSDLTMLFRTKLKWSNRTCSFFRQRLC